MTRFGFTLAHQIVVDSRGPKVWGTARTHAMSGDLTGAHRTDVLRSPSLPGDHRRGPFRHSCPFGDPCLRRAPLPQPLLVPGRCLGTGRPRREGGRARDVGARDHRSPGPLRGGPLLDRGRCGGAAPGRDRGARTPSVATGTPPGGSRPAATGPGRAAGATTARAGTAAGP